MLQVRHPRALALALGSVIAACADRSDPATDSGTSDTPLALDATTAPDALDASDATTAPDALDEHDAGPVIPPHAPLALDWQPCPLMTTAGTGPDAECATVNVPLRWEDPGGASIAYFLKRLRAAPASGPSRGQIWLLNGGPGISGAGIEWMAASFARRNVPFDVYMPDHRGTGRSTRLGCPAQEADASPGGFQITESEWPACLAQLHDTWGSDGLGAFGITESARDLGELITATRAPGEQVFVYGVSYGTAWAQRYLHEYAAQPSGVVLDSICPPDGCEFSRSDEEYNQVGQQFLQLCGADPLCSARLGPDPWARLGDLMTAIDMGQCPGLSRRGLNRPTMRQILGSLIFDARQRLLISPLIYRYLRCEPADVDAVIHLALALRPPLPPGPLYSADVLTRNIGYSEFWEDPPPSFDEITAASYGLLVSRDLSTYLAAEFDAFPRYPHDAYWRRWPETAVPMLMMNGTLDPATVFEHAREVEDHYNGPAQHFVTVPNASHDIVAQTPVAPMETCGMDLVVGFVNDPTAPPDTSCIAQVPPVSFATDAALSMDWFGTADFWDNP